jgi:hypothetical protein
VPDAVPSWSPWVVVGTFTVADEAPADAAAVTPLKPRQSAVTSTAPARILLGTMSNSSLNSALEGARGDIAADAPRGPEPIQDQERGWP